MPTDLVTLIVEGASARNGNIPADAFIAKLKQFVSTIYSFDRSFAGKPKRAIELDIVDLRRVNPAIVSFNPRASIRGYDASASLDWTMEQFQRIMAHQPIDTRVSQDSLNNVIDLARVRKAKIPPISALRVEYQNSQVMFDDRIAGGALTLRATRAIEPRSIWQAGVSRGSVFGELRAATDLGGEKQFWILAPNGAQTQCIFSEDIRTDIQLNLWRTVRVHGYLRYDGNGPAPVLIDAERIEPIDEPARHLSDLYGTFAGSGDPDFQELV